MDKTDLVKGVEMQRRVDGITRVRRLRDEAQSILRHLDLIDEQGTDLEWSDLPEAFTELPDVLSSLKEVEQSLLRIGLEFEAREL